ncbi:Gid4 Glucose-induced degradation protein 4 [Candida maltosa Xu316]|uniref:Uncharacterized protein n=1 Tax=Candida maltosa (strain Xu316) TaxID=1245528 RepID=M3JT58_CANMX|nr:hypothetical protein G210_4354 [Candida maltosa Xu316]
MPVTELNKKNSHQLHQQNHTSSQGNNNNDDDELQSTNNLIDSITTQQQQQHLFNKLQQLQQQKNQNFKSDDEFHDFTDNSTSPYYSHNLHDNLHNLQQHKLLAQDLNDNDDYDNNDPLNKQNSCPIVSAKSSLNQNQSTTSSASPNLSSSQSTTASHHKLSINHQTSKKLSLDYFDQYKYLAQQTNKIPAFNSIYLQPNSQFIGEQQSGKSCFHIKVEFKTVDLFNSLVTGFLQINGLTDANSEITTYFKGEIINNPLNTFNWKNSNGDKHTYQEEASQNYSFITENKQWGSFAKNDFEHWKKLTQSTTFLSDDKLIKRLEKVQNGEEDDQYVYMRWKEEFLLPDSRIKQITGASFEGFYYIVLNVGGSRKPSPNSNDALSPGGISGLYYHRSSEKFQSLSLRHVDNSNDNGTFDFV